jgi:L-threonylcarbamoyladenylate synthase
MKTLVFNSNEIEKAVSFLRRGEIIAIPTETVYGLAADASDAHAAAKIFKAKNRPADNPLIVHVESIEKWPPLVESIPEKAWILAEKFWPGPLTIILKKTEKIPKIVTAQLDYVAVRIPGSDLTRKIISAFGRPIAAPSANLAGKPSPTCIEHVLNDLNGKISAVIDGGCCTVGVESTVVDMSGKRARLLRPGIITPEEISETIKEEILTEDLNRAVPGKAVRSPGMKYKHYAPETKMILINLNKEKFAEFVNSKYNCGALCFDEDKKFIKIPVITYGRENCPEEQLRNLFSALRKIDSLGVETVYVRQPPETGMNLAIFNRLSRAAERELAPNINSNTQP